MDHPNPYKATWVSQVQHVEVKQRALVYFSIGPYQDQVMCDIIPMTCGHIIFGRPWQHLRRTIHNGYTNKYIVHEDSRTFELSSLHCGEHKDNIVIYFGDKI